MSFISSFSAAQGADISSFTLTDDSVGTDSNLSGRTISIYKSDGTLLTGATISWPLSDGSTKTLSGVLTKDFSLNIIVVWASSSPLSPPSVYTASGLFSFVGYTKAFIDEQIGAMASNPNIINDQNFYEDLGKLQTELDNAEEAADTGEQASSQNALDRAKYLIDNSNNFF